MSISPFAPSQLMMEHGPYCTEFNSNPAPDAPIPALPPEIANLLRSVPPVELHARALRVGIDGTDYDCEVFLMKPQKDVLTEPLLAVYLKKERSATEAVRRAARVYRLTQREEETLFAVADGWPAAWIRIRRSRRGR